MSGVCQARFLNSLLSTEEEGGRTIEEIAQTLEVKRLTCILIKKHFHRKFQNT
jgi:hypothetical protein